jgi:hypothetical protein
LAGKSDKSDAVAAAATVAAVAGRVQVLEGAGPADDVITIDKLTSAHGALVFYTSLH